MSSELKTCVCNKKEEVINTFKCCSHCYRAYYCSRECQLADWKRHNKTTIVFTEREEWNIVSNPRNLLPEDKEWLLSISKGDLVTYAERITYLAKYFFQSKGVRTDNQVVICDIANYKSTSKVYFVCLDNSLQRNVGTIEFERLSKIHKDNFLLMIINSKEHRNVAYISSNKITKWTQKNTINIDTTTNIRQADVFEI